MDFPLYQPRHERDACGMGFVAQKDGIASHDILQAALTALANHAHRGAVAADGKSGDGAGVLTQLPHELVARDLARQELRRARARRPRHRDGISAALQPGPPGPRAQDLRRNHCRVRDCPGRVARRAGRRRGARRVGAVAAAIHRANHPGSTERDRGGCGVRAQSSTSSASTRRNVSGPRASATSTCLRYRARPSSTRDCSSRRSWRGFTPTCPIRTIAPRLPCFTSVTAPTHFPPGSAPSRSGWSVTTAKSTRSRAT